MIYFPWPLLPGAHLSALPAHFDVEDCIDYPYSYTHLKVVNDTPYMLAGHHIEGHWYLVHLLPTVSEEREVLGVGSIPATILPYCQDMKTLFEIKGAPCTRCTHNRGRVHDLWSCAPGVCTVFCC